MTKIPTTITVVDMKTGEVKEERPSHFTLLPAGTSDGKCAECAVKHEPSQPRDAQSMYYQYTFYAGHNRWPTWADTIAHCDSKTQELWRAELKKRGAWSEPYATA